MSYNPVGNNPFITYIDSTGKDYKCYKCKGIGVDPTCNSWCMDCCGAGILKTNILTGGVIVCKGCEYKMPVVRYDRSVETEDAMGFLAWQEIAIFKCPNCEQEWHY